jgi:cobalt/nickel transport system permease protein
MHFDLTDQYQPRRSFIHRLDPRVKVVGAVVFILAAGLVPVGSWAAFGVLWILSLVSSTVSRLGWTFALRRSYIALPFGLVALPLLFTVPGDPIFTTPLLGWTLSAQGLDRFLSLMLRSWIAVQAAIQLTAVTPFPDVLWALGALRLPPMLVATIGFMYRYFFVLADETARMLRARTARAANPEGRRGPSPIWHARIAGNMVGSLFLRALERSERVHAAMLARGYDGRIVSFVERRLRPADWATLGAALFLLAGLVAWAYRI